MVLCIFAQTIISELNRTKSNHDHSISFDLFDLVRFGSGFELTKSSVFDLVRWPNCIELFCSIEFDYVRWKVVSISFNVIRRAHMPDLEELRLCFVLLIFDSFALLESDDRSSGM